MGNRMGHQNQDAQVLHCLRSQQPLFQRLEPDKSGTANMWRSKGSIARGLAPYIPASEGRGFTARGDNRSCLGPNPRGDTLWS